MWTKEIITNALEKYPAAHLGLSEEQESTISREQMKRWIMTLENVEKKGEAKFLMLTGNERAFCSGLKLDALLSNIHDAENDLSLFNEFIDRLSKQTIPTIALVEGEVLGGGLGILCACDMAIVKNNVKFGLPETLIGLIPAVIFPWVALKIGKVAAKNLAIGLEPYDTDKALIRGLVEIKEPEPSKVIKVLKRVQQLDTHAVSAFKRLYQAHNEYDANYLKDAISAFKILAESESTQKRIKRLLAGEIPWED